MNATLSSFMFSDNKFAHYINEGNGFILIFGPYTIKGESLTNVEVRLTHFKLTYIRERKDYSVSLYIPTYYSPNEREEFVHFLESQ